MLYMECIKLLYGNPFTKHYIQYVFTIKFGSSARARVRVRTVENMFKGVNDKEPDIMEI